MVHSDDTEFAKTDKTVILKKDENPIINSYYGKVRGFTS
jgi:hypothetical protein